MNEINHGYSCVCNAGYVVKPFRNEGIVSCVDIDECASKSCSHESYDSGHCENEIGSYNCVCKTGFVVNTEKELCEDIDECIEHPDGCLNSELFRCVNTIGSFRCG